MSVENVKEALEIDLKRMHAKVAYLEERLTQRDKDLKEHWQRAQKTLADAINVQTNNKVTLEHINEKEQILKDIKDALDERDVVINSKLRQVDEKIVELELREKTIEALELKLAVKEEELKLAKSQADRAIERGELKEQNAIKRIQLLDKEKEGLILYEKSLNERKDLLNKLDEKLKQDAKNNQVDAESNRVLLKKLKDKGVSNE